MLSPAAGFLERRRIPRAVAAVLIVSAVGAGITFIVGLISSPLMQWSNAAAGAGVAAEGKAARVRPPARCCGSNSRACSAVDVLSAAPFQMPKFDWVQPTLEFLSPTFTEFLLFFATLVLFIASWRDLRRALIMNFGGHDARLRTLRILNEIEEQLGDYLLHGDDDQYRRRRRDRHRLRGHGHAQSGRARRAGRDVEFHSDHRPGCDVRDPDGRRGRRASPRWARAWWPRWPLSALPSWKAILSHRPSSAAGSQLNALAVFIALAFWTWLWGPMGGFLSSPLLIVALILKEHLMPEELRRNCRRTDPGCGTSIRSETLSYVR